MNHGACIACITNQSHCKSCARYTQNNLDFDKGIYFNLKHTFDNIKRNWNIFRGNYVHNKETGTIFIGTKVLTKDQQKIFDSKDWIGCEFS